MVFSEINIKESPNKILKVIEDNCQKAVITREKIRRLKLKANQENQKEISSLPDFPKEKENSNETDEEFEDEVAYYMEDYINLKADFTMDDLLEILPAKSTYRFHDIILRLQAESVREIKELEEFILEDTSLSKDELFEIKKDIDLERKKILSLKAYLKEKENIEKVGTIHNNIILVPTVIGNIRIIDDLEHINPVFYTDFLELINSIVDGSFKGIKRFKNNNTLGGVCEVRGFKVRIVFARLNKDSYALLTAFIKKSDNDKGYRDSLKNKINDFKKISDKLKTLIEEPEFIQENNFYVEQLYQLLDFKDEKKDMKKVELHD